ncbi:MAG: sulfatase [Caldilineaceae bacterium]
MTTQHPNLIYVFPDELRQQAVGFMDGDPVCTPNLDGFAAESLVLTRAVSTCPICSPYRAMLFTGKYPLANRVVTNVYSGTIPYGIELADEERCFTDVLHDAGYHQGYIGKLHLHLPKEEDLPYTEGWRVGPDAGTFWDSYTPPGPGRHSVDFWYSYGCCDQHLTPHYWTGDAPIDQRIDVHGWSVKHETDVAIDYIRNVDGAVRDADKPFALFISHNPPHMPFHEVPPKYLETYADEDAAHLLNRPNVELKGDCARAPGSVKEYFAAITGIDEQFARILATLDEEGLTEDTIVIFTSDHGEMMGSHGLMGKDVWYDESLLVPFSIRWPNRISPGRDDLLLSTPDIMPTLLGLMELAGDIPREVQGSNYAPAILGQPCDRPASAFYFYSAPQFPDKPDRRGVRTHRYTFVIIRHEEGDQLILHDNVQDPYQLENIAAHNPDVVEMLVQELNGWLHKTGDPWYPLERTYSR